MTFLTTLRASALAGMLAPVAAMAQSMDATGSACVDSLEPSSFFRVPVLLNATVPDAKWTAVLPGADFLTQSVALRVREILGSARRASPAGPVVHDCNALGKSCGRETPAEDFLSGAVAIELGDWERAVCLHRD